MQHDQNKLKYEQRFIPIVPKKMEQHQKKKNKNDNLITRNRKIFVWLRIN